MFPVGFETAVLASDRPQTHTLDRAATDIVVSLVTHYCISVHQSDAN